MVGLSPDFPVESAKIVDFYPRESAAVRATDFRGDA